jgi:hypothetical protein
MTNPNIEPIPFMGLVDIEERQVINDLDEYICKNYGNNPENVPKYVVLGDGSFYIFHKEEHRYAICEQATPLQEGVPATTGKGGTAQEERSGEGSLRNGQEGDRQERQGH